MLHNSERKHKEQYVTRYCEYSLMYREKILLHRDVITAREVFWQPVGILKYGHFSSAAAVLIHNISVLRGA